MKLVLNKNLPIGVLDSGIGGLTVAKALTDILPNESVVYFGDTVNLPYGDKTKNQIQDHTKGIIDFFLEKGVKLILLACNTISAASYEMLQDYVGDRALVIDVIDPLVKFLSESYKSRSIGLIGTKFTIESEIYIEKLSESDVDLCSLATPKLASIIESSGFDHEEIDEVLSDYLSSSVLQDIEALVLGCTHYPFIKDKISDFYNNNIDVIDASEIIAEEVGSLLSRLKLLSPGPAKYNFYVSENTKGFARGLKKLFGGDVKISSFK